MCGSCAVKKLLGNWRTIGELTSVTNAVSPHETGRRET